MLNVNELEKKWLYYRVKMFIPFIFIFVGIVILVVAMSYIDFNQKFSFTPEQNNKEQVNEELVITTKKAILKPNKEDTNTSQVPDTIVTEKVAPKPEVQKDKTKLKMSPSLDFMQSIESTSPQYYDYEHKAKKAAAKKKKQVVKKPLKPIEVVQPLKDPVVQIKRKDTQDDMSEIINRFKKSNKPSLGIFIAKKYYARKDYKQSYNYALITNEIDSNYEESWLLVAKSLVKLRQKEKAMSALQQYISHSQSTRAQTLLDTIKSGKFQ